MLEDLIIETLLVVHQLLADGAQGSAFARVLLDAASLLPERAGRGQQQAVYGALHGIVELTGYDANIELQCRAFQTVTALCRFVSAAEPVTRGAPVSFLGIMGYPSAEQLRRACVAVFDKRQQLWWVAHPLARVACSVLTRIPCAGARVWWCWSLSQLCWRRRATRWPGWRRRCCS